MAIRTSVLAEVKALSLASLYDRFGDPAAAKDFINAASNLPDPIAEFENKGLFVTVGLAKSIRIDDDFGTTAVFGIGGPTRPALVPGNYTVNMTIERLQLDRRNNFSYITSPEYWYSAQFQKETGLNDWLMYSYIKLFDREQTRAGNKDEIYAMMPRSASQGFTSNDVMITHSVSLIGFKYRFLDILNQLAEDDTFLDLARTYRGEGRGSGRDAGLLGDIVKTGGGAGSNS